MKVGYVRVSSEEQNTARQEAVMEELGVEKVFLEKATGRTREGRGVDFISKKEAINTKTPSGKFMLTVFGAIAQLEREYILDRQREGIEIARQKGKYKGRKPLAIDKDRFMEVYGRWKSGSIKGVEAMRELDLKPSTFYRRVREYEGRSRGHDLCL